MNESDDRLSHARQLLKKYQNKRQHPVENGSSSTSTPLNGHGTPNSIPHGHHGHYHDESENESAEHEHFAHSVGSSRPCSTSFHDGVQRNPSFPHYQQYQDENANLRQQLIEKDVALKDITDKLQALHTHYAELHNTYNLLSQSLNSASPEYAQQISQLQTALAVAIEEKTSLQSELRVTLAKLEESETQKLTIQEEHYKSSRSSTTTEIEFNKLKNENHKLLENVKNQSEQIEAHRKECSNLEAKILMVQQDRNDTQARLKNMYTEKESLEKHIDKLKSELNMKEIYIRQLTRHSTTSNQLEDEGTIRSLTDEKSRLVQELDGKKLELLEAQREMGAIRQYYESCMRDLNAQTTKLEEEFQSVAHAKKELESTNYCLQSEIESLRSKLDASLRNADSEKMQPVFEAVTDYPSDTTLVPVEVDPVEMQALRNSLVNLQSAYENQIEKTKELERVIETKNSQLGSLEEVIFEAKHEIENLRQSMEVRKTMENDVALLSEQLQNERATVSRAVSQNMDLKEQLAELQDKLVAMANDSAEREDERQTVLRTIQRLREQIEEMNSQEGIKKETYDQDTQTASLEESTTIIHEFEREVKELTIDECQQTELSLLDATIESTLLPAPLPINGNQHQTLLELPRVEKTDTATQYEEDRLSEINLNTEARSEATSETEIPADAYFRKPLQSTPSDTGSLCTSSGDEALVRHGMLKELEVKLEKATQEKEQYKVTNERLEYFLAALESENETIGEYISIYRFQRNNYQKRIAEKDAMIAQLKQEKAANQAKIDELHVLINNLLTTLHQSHSATSLINGTAHDLASETRHSEVPETTNGHGQTKVAKADQIHKMLEIITDLKAHQGSFDTDSLLHCTECKGKLIVL